MNWFSEWSLYLTEVIPNYIYKKYAGYTLSLRGLSTSFSKV